MAVEAEKITSRMESGTGVVEREDKITRYISLIRTPSKATRKKASTGYPVPGRSEELGALARPPKRSAISRSGSSFFSTAFGDIHFL